MFETETRRVIQNIPPGPRLVVIGSGSFHTPRSERLCEEISVNLAGIAALVAVTGGRHGAGRTFGRAFIAARHAAGQAGNLFHLVPHGEPPCDHGATLWAGANFIERREVLGRIGQLYLVFEGGPGTQYEADIAIRHRTPIIPLACTGGHAAEIYSQVSCPDQVRLEDWKTLAQPAIRLNAVVAAVGRMARATLGSN